MSHSQPQFRDDYTSMFEPGYKEWRLYLAASTSSMLTACGAWCRAKEMVILGTQYAGEMKKGIFTVMHYLMPKRGILSLHSGCNVGKNDDVTLFFGLSGDHDALLQGNQSI